MLAFCSQLMPIVNFLGGFVRKIVQNALVAVLAATTGQLYAEDVKITGTISKVITVPADSTSTKTLKSNNAREIKLLKLKLSDKARQVIAKKARLALIHLNRPMGAIKASNNPLPAEKQLGMNGVPVLNQGQHGSCVTFAVTAALDAVIKKGDYVSQLCQLQLGNYLEQQGYVYNGWDGSWGSMVLGQIDVFGFMNANQQKSKGCGGLYKYPLDGAYPTSYIHVEDFHRSSESLDSHGIAWSFVLNPINTFVDEVDSTKTLNDVKAALVKGDRIPFGTALPDSKEGIMGAAGTKNKKYDTWLLTPDIIEQADSEELPGHEMIITGYDDNAVAYDATGKKHQGLLTLRNSWGTRLGDNGNYYMTYDYFKLFANEALRIHHFN